jgi:anaerobic selenocysteine-containing dehydrogenase
MQDLIREQAEALRSAGGGNIQAVDVASDYWNELLQTGVWMDQEAAAGETGETGETGALPPVTPPQYAGEEGEFPYYLVPFESPSIGAGQHAHIPWLQGLPDPITTVTWSSWVNLNPETAEELEVSTGDIVRVSTPVGLVEVQAYVNPATPPNVAAIPMGQGHAFYTRYAEGRGVNVLTLLDPALIDTETGSLAWAGLRANVQRSPGEHEKLPRMEGAVEMVVPDDYELIRVVPPDAEDH